ncbi:hypothetical protein SLS58_007298 [Diplodia intermedia]|uniref:Uncharacterized protein n=1 Tax=Diplodia intermedia TaxID=856260 RepID=A0ABR3TKU1_9PEZI
MMEQQLIRGLERRITNLALIRDGPGAARYLESRGPSLFVADDLNLDDRAKSFVDLDGNKDLHGGFGRVYSWPCLRVRPLEKRDLSRGHYSYGSCLGRYCQQFTPRQ